MNKSKLLLGVGGVALVLAIIGGYFYPSFAPQSQTASASPANSTFTSAKVAQVAGWTLTAPGSAQSASGVGTTTSILNTDANDRIVTDSFVDCNTMGTSFSAYAGAGLISSGLTVTAATTSGLVSGALGNANVTVSSIVATTSANVYVASSTVGVANGAYVRIWASGTYMSWAANATNTAVCTVGVHYIGS